MAGEPLLLHAAYIGPNPLKVAILLEALNLSYNVKHWKHGDDPATGVKGPAFLKINENGRAPALEDPNTGVIAWESAAVMSYILRKYDTAHKFYPSPDAPEQQQVDFDKWIAFMISTLAPMSGQAVLFRNHHPRKNEDAIERYTDQTYRCYTVLEGQLAKSGGASVLEQGYSAVDMHFFPWLKLHTMAGLSLEKYPNIEKWLGAIGERPEVKKAYEYVTGGVTLPFGTLPSLRENNGLSLEESPMAGASRFRPNVSNDKQPLIDRSIDESFTIKVF